MREIKFRAYENIQNTMHYDVQSGIYEDPDEIISFDRILELQRYAVMQYTGLKDKNSKEIYESDIIKYRDSRKHIVPVERVKELGTGMYLRRVGSGYYTLNDSVIKDYDVEVIGNIYENPELLEG